MPFCLNYWRFSSAMECEQKGRNLRAGKVVDSRRQSASATKASLRKASHMCDETTKPAIAGIFE